MCPVATTAGVTAALTSALLVVIGATYFTFFGSGSTNENISDLAVDPNGPDIQFILFTRNHPPLNVKIGDMSLLSKHGFNSTKPTKIIIHGFKSSIKEDIFTENKNAYLDSGDYNVIGMDWSRLCQNEYLLAVQETKKAGFILSILINWLTTSLAVNSEKIHVVGHSLGAHVAGIAGQLMAEDKKFGRITGLDPAGPGFKEVNFKLKLDKADAKIVDVIHTYGKILSTLRPMGHIDFYPNGGRWQPGCPDVYDIWKMSESLQCNHARAYYLFAESIRNKQAFRSTKCVDIQQVFNGTCDRISEVHMGQSGTYTEDGLYYVRTKSEEPFTY